MDAQSPSQQIDQRTLTPIVQRVLESATVDVTEWEPTLGSRSARGMGTDALHLYRVSGQGPRCLGTLTKPDGALWTWLEEVTDADGPHWQLARYGLAARHVGHLGLRYGVIE